MKLPKFVLRVAGQQFVIPHNSGISALVNLMTDAVPVHADMHNREIELLYTDDEDGYMLPALQQVSITRIPPGTKWKRKTKDGRVEIIRPVAVEQGRPSPKTNGAKRLKGSAPLQLEFGR